MVDDYSYIIDPYHLRYCYDSIGYKLFKTKIMKEDYTREEVVELFQEFRVDHTNLDTSEKVMNFLKDKGLIKDKLEVGKWYWYNDFLLVWNGGDLTYGFINYGNYFTDLAYFSTPAIEREATKEEVEEALIKEAKKRGFDNKEEIRFLDFSNEEWYAYGNVELQYKHNQLRVYADCSGTPADNYKDNVRGFNVLMEGGKWATLIEETKEMTVAEIEKELGHKVKVIK